MIAITKRELEAGRAAAQALVKAYDAALAAVDAGAWFEAPMPPSDPRFAPSMLHERGSGPHLRLARAEGRADLEAEFQEAARWWLTADEPVDALEQRLDRIVAINT